MTDTLCKIDKLGLTCMGCCGFDYKNKEEVSEGIDKNTLEFQDFVHEDGTLIDLKGFRDRHPQKTLRISGICYNVCWKDIGRTKVFCPLHPLAFEYETEDIRQDHCDPNYLCKAMHHFSKWDKKKQDKFIVFIEYKKLDWYCYSILMDNNALIEEFLELEK